MTSVYVTNVVRKIEVTPGATGGSGGSGGSGNLTTNNSWTGTNTFNNNVSVVSASDVSIPIIIKGSATQTSSLTEWRNSSNSVIAAVDSTGQISSATNIYVGRGVSSSGGNKVLVLSNATAPTSNPVGGGILYAESGALKYRDSSGVIYVPIPLSGTKGDILAHTGTGWTKVPAGTNGYVLTSNSAQSSGVEWTAAGTGSGHVIQDEGNSLTQRSTLNFVGAGVAVTDVGSKTTVTITGGSSYYQTLKTNGTPRTQRAAINYGTMFTLTDDAGNDETDIAVVSDQAAGTASLRTLGTGSTQAAAGNHTHNYEASGTAASLIATHEAAIDPHAQYLTQDDGDAVYAPLITAPPSGGTTGQVLTKASSSNYAYQWSNSSATLTIPYTAVGTSTGTVPFTIQGYPGQATDLFRVNSNGGSTYFAVNQLGETMVGAGGSVIPGVLKVRPVSNTGRGLVIRGQTSQSGNLLEVQEVGGTALASIGPDGTITAPNIGVKVLILANGAPVPAGTPSGSLILREP